MRVDQGVDVATLHRLSGVVTHCVGLTAPFSAAVNDGLSMIAADALASRPRARARQCGVRPRSAISSATACGTRHRSKRSLCEQALQQMREAGPWPSRGPILARPPPPCPDDHDRLRLPPASAAGAGHREKPATGTDAADPASGPQSRPQRSLLGIAAANAPQWPTKHPATTRLFLQKSPYLKFGRDTAFNRPPYEPRSSSRAIVLR